MVRIRIWIRSNRIADPVPDDNQVLVQIIRIRSNAHDAIVSLFSFEFAPNPFFSNTTLTKTYALRENPDPDSPLEYDGPEIIR